MDNTECNFFQALSQTYKKDYEIEITFNGAFPTDDNALGIPGWLASIITELVHNSPAVRQIDDAVPDEDEMNAEELIAAYALAVRKAPKPRQIIITGQENSLTVEDNIKQPDVELAMSYINRALAARRGGRDLTSKSHRIGGSGINTIKAHLAERGGNLTYSAVDKRIIAIARWASSSSLT